MMCTNIVLGAGSLETRPITNASGRKRPLLSPILEGIYDRFTPKAAVFRASFALPITSDKEDYR
jgi:hypothetical protein